MADLRPPGDILIRSRSRVANFRYERSNLATSAGSVSYTDFRSFRPSYNKGAVITLPSGLTFRKSTAYSHESWEVGAYSVPTVGPAPYNGHARWFGIDEGRDGALFLSGNPVLVGKTVPVDARNEAVTKALTKIADQKVNLGENLATLNQTIGLFTSRLDILVTALQKARRNKHWWKFFQDSARDIKRKGIDQIAAGEYLAYVYGLRPLMQDVWTMHELMKKKGLSSDLLLKAVGSAQRSQFQGSRTIGPASYSLQKQLSWTSESRTKCTIWARIDPNYRGLRALNQLGLLNPAGLAWDLIPYSFCIDWVLPIGPVLYAMSAPAGLIFVDGSISFRNSETRMISYEIEAGSWAFRYLKVQSPTVVPIAYEGYDRSRLTTWPLPGLWFDQDPFRGDRIFKALALAIIALGGSRSPIR